MRDKTDGSEGTYLHDLGNIQVNISLIQVHRNASHAQPDAGAG